LFERHGGGLVGLNLKQFSVLRVDSVKKAQEALTNGAFDLVLLKTLQAATRLSAIAEKSVLKVGELTVSLDDRRVHCADLEIILRRREFDALVFLMRHENKIISREMLITALGLQYEVSERAVDSQVARLRKKLFKATDSRVLIKTIYGIGYRLERSR